MDKSTLWLDLYRGCLKDDEHFFEHFKRNGSDESWYIDYVEDPDGIPLYELHLRIDGDKVLDANVFKADVYCGGGRPVIEEKGLTSEEKKHAKEVFSLCLRSPAEQEIDDVIVHAVDEAAEYNGFQIVSQTKAGVSYRDPAGKKKSLGKDKILQALHYSHLYLDMLLEADFVQEFCECQRIKLFEPLYAILRTVDPSEYSNYESLNLDYRRRKLLHTLKSKELTDCMEYEDVLHSMTLDSNQFLLAAISRKNLTLGNWILCETTGNPSDLTRSLCEAIESFSELIPEILKSGRCAPDTVVPYSRTAMQSAVEKQNDKLVKELLERGHSLDGNKGKAFYDSLNLDEMKELLPYRIRISDETLERIWNAGRVDILETLESETDRYLPSDRLLKFYIRHNLHDRFCNGLSKQWKCDEETFELCYAHSLDWTEELLAQGFDLNIKDGCLIHRACDDQDYKRVVFLVEHGADLHLRAEYSQTVLECAATSYRLSCEGKMEEKGQICEYLLRQGLNPIEESRRSPSVICSMMCISKEFRKKLVDYLIEHGMVNQPDLAIEFSQERDNIPHLPIYYLLERLYVPDVDLALYMLDHGAVVNAAGLTKDKLFLSACQLENMELVKKFIELGADIDESDRLGHTALHDAVRSGKFELCQLLISNGANVNAVSKIQRIQNRYPFYEEQMQTVLDVAIKNIKIALIC